MVANQFFYNQELVYFTELSNRTLRSSFNIINSFYKVINVEKAHEKNLFECFEHELRKIIPVNEMVKLLEEIINDLPNRRWGVEDYQGINETIEKFYSEEVKKEEIQDILKELFESNEDVKYFLKTYLQKLAIFANEQIPLWEDMLVNDSNSMYENLKTINEVILTLKSFIEVNEKQKKGIKGLMDAFGHVILKILRIIQVTYFYKAGKYEKITPIVNFLREERFEMKYDLKLI